MGMVFQNFNLFPHKKVIDNIILAPSLLKKGSQNELKKEAMDLLKKVDWKIKLMHIHLNYPGTKTKSCDC